VAGDHLAVTPVTAIFFHLASARSTSLSRYRMQRALMRQYGIRRFARQSAIVLVVTCM
jgi:hypothetical protein